MHRKTRVTKSWLVLVLHLIDCESGASFLDQSQSELSKYNYYSNLLAAGLNTQILVISTWQGFPRNWHNFQLVSKNHFSSEWRKSTKKKPKELEGPIETAEPEVSVSKMACKKGKCKWLSLDSFLDLLRGWCKSFSTKSEKTKINHWKFG